MRIRTAAAFVAALLLTTPVFAFKNAAWIPPWDGNALTSMQLYGSAIDESNPVWYSMNSNGTLAKNWNAETPSWRASMAASRMVPTIQNIVNQSYDATVIANLLATEAARTAHVNEILQLAVAQAFDGIDIDYERVPTSSRAGYTAFVQLLASKLHAANKTLSITVYAKTSDKQNWNGPGAQDWSAIAGVADSVKIMAYDYHESSSGPGAITPLDWLDQVATYAESVIPASKIFIGLPFYGYDWSGSSAKDMTYDAAMKVAQNNGATISRDVNGEPNYTYPGGHTVYFEDATSYQRKIDLIKQKHGSIAGIAHWCVGVEDAAIWNVIRGASAPVTPVPVTPVAADFTVSGAAAIAVQQGSGLTSDFRIVPINSYSAATFVTISAPPALGATISTAVLAIDGVLTLHVQPTASGTFPVVLHFTSGNLAHDMTVNVTVSAPPAPAPSTGKRRASKH
jgi:spore germination protein